LETRSALWKKRRGYFLFVLLFLIVSGSYFLTTDPAYLLYFKVKAGKISSKLLWKRYDKAKKRSRLYDYVYYLLLKKEDFPPLDFYWKKYKKCKVSDVYSDDIYYLLLLKGKHFTYNYWKRFITLFPRSPWKEELAVLVIQFYKEKNGFKIARKVLDDLENFFTPWSNIILKENGIYSGYYWKIYAHHLSRKL